MKSLEIERNFFLLPQPPTHSRLSKVNRAPTDIAFPFAADFSPLFFLLLSNLVLALRALKRFPETPY
jgi:hypothetical protein